MARMLYLIAGEPSGDLLGARLMRALKQQTADLTIIGIGGPAMEAEGLQSLFPMRELSLMGFAEIIPHIPRLLSRIRQTAQDIIAKNPAMVITIDSPGFCFRVVKAVRKQLPKTQFVHYVAPSVWAYKPSRARKLAKLYDRVLTLLPFEPEYFTREGMQANFVGHPLVETAQDVVNASAEGFRIRYDIDAHTTVITMLPGSRQSELQCHLPIQREVAQILSQHIPDMATVMPYVPHLENMVRSQTQDWPTKLILVEEAANKWAAFKASKAALAKSGTVSLELALAGIPTVVMYKAHPLSAWIIRKMLKTPYVSLVNILQNKPIIPELLQEQAAPKALSHALLELLKNPSAQLVASTAALKQLGLGEALSPSEKAARVILDSLA